MHLSKLRLGLVGVACAMVVGMGAGTVAAVSTALPDGENQIAYFDNNLYTDVDGESVNLAASLTAQGHTLNSFSGITAADWNAATAAADLLVIPELDNGDLFAALDAAAINAINSYIANGGGLIMFDRTTSAPHTIDFLNGIFGYALQPGFISGIQVLNAAVAAGTEFEGGPPALPDSNATEGLTTASLPPGSLSLYEQGATTSVLAVDEGSGRIAFLGFDWFELPTPPDWEAVLGNAVSHVQTSGPADSDGDGIPDDEDACPESILTATIVIDGCDSGVGNLLFEDGCTMADLIAECADGAANHGQFVSCVAHLTNEWKRAGLITGREKGRIQSCAARSNIPGDLDGDGAVGVADLVMLLGEWGPCRAHPDVCPADIDLDDIVGISDLLILLGNWG